MDGMHDLGGRQGFGAVEHHADAPVFHAAWEKRINALYALAVRLGIFNMDEYRHAIERMAPRHYMAAGYYERTLTSVATLCVEKGVLRHDELQVQAGGAFPLALPAQGGRSNVATRLALQVGDRVRVRSEHVSGHVRMPAYVRGKVGVVVGIAPLTPFADAHAHGLAAADEPTYDVRFWASELWPEACDEASVHVGLFESYLQPEAVGAQAAPTPSPETI